MSPFHGVVERARNALLSASTVSLLALGWASNVGAVPAIPDVYSEIQPDGTQVQLRLRGDEHFNWTEDRAGYTVLKSKGWLEYARLNPQGRLVPSGLKVGKGDPKAYGLRPGMLPSAAQRAASSKDSSSSTTGMNAASVSPTGSIRNLVVLIRFSNHIYRALPSTQDIEVLFNAPGGDPVLAPTGSLRDLYLQNSYGQMELNSDIAPWITVSGTEQYYANGASGDSTLWQALREALDVLDQSVDFSEYDGNNDGYIDSITFLHSGYGAEWGSGDAYGTYFTDRIWSHRWVMQPEWNSAEGVAVGSYHISPAVWGRSGSEIGRIGVIAHETGHFFGLPDLYDTDGGGNGIGSYGLMANSWGFDGGQRCPSSFSPWSKMQLGWIAPSELTNPGEYEIAQSVSNPEYFRISSGYPSGEYLLLENRQREGSDCALPQGGLLIWHIDELADFNEEGFPDNRWPRDGKHYRVALAQADGNFQMEKGQNRGDEGDIHHGDGIDAMAPGPDLHPNTDAYQSGRIVATGNTISNISVSAPVMTFCYNGCGGVTASTVEGYAPPSNLSANLETIGKGKNAVTTVKLSWADNSNGEENEDLFVIERCEETGKGKGKTCVFASHATVGRDVNSYSETPGSGTFMYRVKARRGASDDTAYSNEVKI